MTATAQREQIRGPSGAGTNERRLREVADWLEQRGGPEDAEATHAMPSRPERPPARGPIARAGAVPAIEPQRLTPAARAHAADASFETAAETVRMGRDDPQHPQHPPDPRLSNPQVSSLRPPAVDVASHQTVAAPGGLASALGEAPDRSIRRSPGESTPERTGPIIPLELAAARPAAPRKSAAGRAEAARPQPKGQPKTRGRTGGPEVRFTVAPLWRRVISTLIDGGIVVALIVLPIREGWFGERLQNIQPLEPDDLGRALFAGELTMVLALAALAFLVLGIIPHAVAGRTIGKLATGLMVVGNRTGQRPGWSRVIVRQVLGLATTLVGLASYFWLIMDRRSSTLHDRLAGTTCVIASSRAVVGRDVG